MSSAGSPAGWDSGADVGLIVASPDSQGVHPDHEITEVVGALEAAGLRTIVVPWTARVDWGNVRALVLKSPWDYSMRSEEFARWLDHVEDQAVVLNPPAIVRWNYDKRYLRALLAGGVNATPFVTVDSLDRAKEALGDLGRARVVVKPTVSAGSRHTGLFEASDLAALQLVARILELGKTPMLMPALDAVEREGERGLVFFGGEFSHCGRKAPILARGGGYLGGQYTEIVDRDEPDADEIELGAHCLRLIADVATGLGVAPRHATPLYARIDVARGQDGRPCILEAELFEPSYFTGLDPRAAPRFAAALQRYLG
ncbi:RimK family alpha-L-glutamate ligase [Angustibacter sp. Root456]|uniref:ATP-grasp domain-containing protein n=1 Tax=Angustibacter sp. Root456 TaxID=1736539 RepID=UPI0007006641|nr:hypothetical protein [Angustibacter sp. Root456]KQX65660.1 hypothetical protein ASD06_08500 [Angustibacter sp. Root456]